MFIIPNQQTKKHSQTNKSDLSGTIYQSKNINLDQEGYIKLADATFAQYSTTDSADFDDADAMLASDDEIFINSDEEFSGTAGLGALTNRNGDTNKTTPGVEQDVTYFNGTEVVSDGANIDYRSDTTEWTTVDVSGGAYDAGNPTALCVYDNANVLAVGNSNVVKFINTSWAVETTVLTLPVGYRVTSMACIGNSLFIATRNVSGLESRFFITNSVQTTYDYSYPTGSFELPSIKTFKSSIIGINSLGQLIRFNGGGFDVLATLPIYNTDLEWADALNDYSRVSNRGITIDGDLIYVNLSSVVEAGRFKMLPGFLSGVWCYDDSNGAFYHRYSPSYSTIKTITNPTVDATLNTFTGGAGSFDGCVTGMPVFYSAAAEIPELREGGRCYFLIKDSSTVCKLASTYADAIAGTAIDISATGTTNVLTVIKTNDYGSGYHDNRAAIVTLNSKLFDSDYVGRICMTANLMVKQATTDTTVFCPTSPYLPNRGYFVTPRLNSQEATDKFNTFSLKFKPLDTDDKIVVKYKTQDRLNFPKTSLQFGTTTKWKGTWTDTDSFTTTSDLSGVVAGDEVEIIAGVGSGITAHVSSITYLTGTYTVNLDETFPFAVANDIFYFVVDNWTKLTTIDSTNTDHYYQTQLGNEGKFIQVKVEMRGIGLTIEELQINNKNQLPTKK